MLIATFQSAPADYHVTGETVQDVKGVLFDGAFYYVPYLSYLSGTWGVFVWTWSADGSFAGTLDFAGGLLDKLFCSNACRSRNGQMYLVNNWGAAGTLRHCSRIDMQTWGCDGDGDISASRFGAGLNFFTYPAVDEQRDLMIDLVYGENSKLGVWQLSTGTKLPQEVQMPSPIVATALQDADRIWLLLNNRVLVLFNYVYWIVLGAVRIPIAPPSSVETKLAWDFVLERLIYIQKLPDGPGGICSELLTGFRNIPVPVRLMPPVPVQVARKGGTMQLMANLLGDMNEPVGGALIDTTVTGPNGKLIGIPFTDGYGRSFMKVECDDAGDVPVACSATLPDYISG